MTWMLMGFVWLAAPLGPPVPATPAVPSTVAPTEQPPAPPAFGQPVVPTPRTLVLTLPQALRIGLARDHDVRIGKLDAIIARANETKSYAVYQPQVQFILEEDRFNTPAQSITVGGTTSGGVGESHRVSFRVTQLLFDTAQGLYNIFQAQSDARNMEFQELETELTVAKRIASDFYAGLTARALIRLNNELVAQAKRQLDLAQARNAAGTAARLDVTRAQVALSNAQVQQAAAVNQEHTALANLRYDLVIPPGAPLELSESFTIPPVELGLQEAIATARKERPSISAAQAQVRSRRAALTAASIARWVTLSINGSYEVFVEATRSNPNQYSLVAQLSIPLWDGQTGRLNQVIAEQAYQRAGEQLKQAMDRAAVDVEQAEVTWEDASTRLTAAVAAAQLATQVLAQTEESYRLGVSSLLDVNDARTAFAQAEANRIQAQVDRDLASINLRLAVGRMPYPPGAPLGDGR